ncbi:MAG: 1-acyl-sn-glycerol-3-phosphate acyltransferase [Candidatus Marinimicrobia bacterium]|nr:1-acyl-sn-glycerol-3-phosphate acyltransferase [Candidatus Neomarinimicrobiota bacterium]
MKTDVWVTIAISIIAVPLFIILAIILMIASIIARPLIFPMAKIVVRIMLVVLGIRLKIEGSFPDKGQYIIMSNHCSFIDVLLLPAVIKGKYTAVVALYNFKYPVWKQLLLSFKVIPIDRYNRTHAVNGIQTAEEVIKTKGYHVILLPEGGRTETGKMKPLKKGGFHMAINTNTPILPIGLEGAYEYKPFHRKTFKPGKVIVRVGDPITTDRYESLGLDGLLRETELNLKTLSGEV